MPEIERSRAQFTKLLAANPNHFGTLTEKVFAEFFPVIELKQADTRYEEIGCVSFSPERDRLEATVVVKLAAGYSGGPCSTGSLEYVRFFVDYGAGWEDAGAAAARVHDIPVGKDCAGIPDHPYIHVVGVPLAPRRRWCATPVLPRVRAILSWQVEPTAGDPNFLPVWGEIQEDSIQIRPRPNLHLADVADVLGPQLNIDPGKIKKIIEDEIGPIPFPDPEGPIPLPGGPIPPLPDPIGPVALNPQPLPPEPPAFSLEKLVRLYSPEKLKDLSRRATDRRVARLALDPVPPHRLAAAEGAAALQGVTSSSGLAKAMLAYKKLDIDWEKVIGILDDGKGDTTYEELECLGLDNAAGQFVATFRVKRPTGFSGPPCSAGSREYVAFWADFDDDCQYTYLGTVAVNAHDYITMPAGGLSYAAILPVDLGAVRRHCEKPGVHRIRAVLSWNTPPSTTDPDAVPHWGNRLDTHVHVLPGKPYDGVARFTIVGGVATSEINAATGVTLPGAHIAYNGVGLGARSRPFAGRVTAHGATDPALAGTTYRLLVRNVTAGGSATPLLTPFYVVDSNTQGSWVTPGAGGWTAWPQWNTNTLGTLGYFNSSGDDLWELQLELSGSGVVDSQRVRLDNTLNAASVDPANAAHLAFDPGQLSQQVCGKFTQGMQVTGTYDARDTWFDQWAFTLSPFPLPAGALTTSVALTTAEAPVGSTWALDTSGLQPCGYVLRLYSYDLAVLNSVTTGRHVPIEIGFCIE